MAGALHIYQGEGGYSGRDGIRFGVGASHGVAMTWAQVCRIFSGRLLGSGHALLWKTGEWAGTSNIFCFLLEHKGGSPYCLGGKLMINENILKHLIISSYVYKMNT